MWMPDNRTLTLRISLPIPLIHSIPIPSPLQLQPLSVLIPNMKRGEPNHFVKLVQNIPKQNTLPPTFNPSKNAAIRCSTPRDNRTEVMCDAKSRSQRRCHRCCKREQHCLCEFGTQGFYTC